MRKTLYYFFTIYALLASTLSFGQTPAPITGPNKVCAGATIKLSDATSGGTWSSLTPSIATVNTASGVVGGVSAGNVTIKYSTAGGSVTTVIAVNTVQQINPGGNVTVCQLQSVAMTNTTPGGGTWSSSNTSIATINAPSSVTANIYGAIQGNAVISFTSAAGCVATRTLMVNPNAPMTGTMTVCMGQTTQLSNSIAGGTWSSSAASQATIDAGSGLVSGRNAGTTIISYTLPSGCKTGSVVTVNALQPILPAGALSVCTGKTLALANNTQGGGTWSSSFAPVATVGVTSPGVAQVSGIATGSVLISFTTPAGCITEKPLDVNPSAVIQSNAGGIMCQGRPGGMYTDIGGGTWSSSLPSAVNIDASSGEYMAQGPGTATIRYTLQSGCMTSSVLVVYPLQKTLPEQPLFCEGQQTILTNSTAGGGTWSTQNTYAATLTVLSASSVRVNAYTRGGADIIFTAANGGCTWRSSSIVNPTNPIQGLFSPLCMDRQSQIYAGADGGTWSSSNPAAATISSGPGAALLTPVAPGTTTIKYINTQGCITTSVVTVAALVQNVPTNFRLCQGESTIITNTTPGGGTWNLNGGVYGLSLTPLTATTARITSTDEGGGGMVQFITNGGCQAGTQVYVAPKARIMGATSVCTGRTITLSSSISYPGGTWSSSNADIATVTDTSVSEATVSGVTAGKANIVYTTSLGCITSTTITASRCELSGIRNIEIYPNPNQGTFTLKGLLNIPYDQEVIVHVTDMLGRIIQSTSIIVMQGELNEQIQLDNLQKGMYMVILAWESHRDAYRFVVQ